MGSRKLTLAWNKNKSMQISKHKKGSDDYLIEMTDFVINDLVYEKEHLYKAYNYYNGKRDKYQYENLEENFGIGNPTSISFTPLIRKHIDAIVGEFLTTEIRPKISCKDEKTLTNINRDKQLELAKKNYEWVSKFLTNSIYEAIQTGGKGQQGQGQQQQQIQDAVIEKELQDIKESVDLNFISNYEIAGQNIVQYIMQSRKMDFKNKLHQILLDLLIAGEAYYKVVPTSSGTNFKIEIEDPLNTWVDKDPKSRYLKNGYKSVVRKWMTTEEIIIKYGDYLSQKDINDLDDFKGYDYDNRHMIMVTGLGARCGDFSNPGMLDNVGVHPEEYNYDSYTDRSDLIPVYEVEWIDWEKQPDGHRIGKRYECVRIGQDIYILKGEDKTVVRDMDAPNEITLRLNGMFYTDGHGNPYSLMLKTADLQDDYDLLMYFKNNIVALSGTKGAIVDMATLPENLGDNFEERLMKFLAYRKTGISLINSAQEGMPPNQIYNGYDDTVNPGSLQAIQAALEIIEATASSITGVFRERLGGIQQRDAVANVEAGMQQSYIITKQYYQVMDTLVAEMLTDALDMARHVYKKGLTGQIILGDRKEIFTLLPENYSQTDYDVHLANSVDIMKEQELIRQLATQLAGSNMIDPEILILVSTSKSLTELKTSVQRSIKEKKIENNQLQQLQQQLQEAQKNLQQMQQQLEESTRKITQLNEKKLNIEQQNNQMQQNIDWFKVKSDADNKKKELELIEKRNKIELAQIVADDGRQNDDVNQKRM